MNNLKNLKKRILENPKRTFPEEMYTTLLGSFLITMYLTKSTDKTPLELSSFYWKEKKLWKKNKANKETWMQDICDKLSTVVVETEDGRFTENTHNTKIPYGNCALTVYKANNGVVLGSLIAPYLDTGDGPVLLPLREDGLMPATLKYGKIFPIVEETTCGTDDER